MSILLGIIGALGAALAYFFTKAKSAGTLNENVKTKNAVNDARVSIDRNNVLIEAEQEKRSDVHDNIQRDSERVVSNEEVVKFLNDFGNKPKAER